jgi:formyl-CoA transferase
MQKAYGTPWVERLDGVAVPPSPLTLDGLKPPVRARPPRLGEHTDAILRELGLDAERVSQLYASGVVRSA